MNYRVLVATMSVALLGSCVDSSPEIDSPLNQPAEANQDSQPGGLFHDFIEDGKYDAAGHPQGAEVFEGAERCAPQIGEATKFGIAAQLDFDEAGVLCGAETRALGDGTFTLNVRAMIVEAAKQPAVSAEDELAPILELVVREGETEVASRQVTAADFGEAGIEQDLAVAFRHRGDTAVQFEVRWLGEQSVRLSYVELFRSTPRLVVSPASRVLDFAAGPTFEIEMQDPPDDLSFQVACDDTDLTDVLDGMLESGEATWEDTDFRTVVRAPSEQLFEGCATPSKVRVQALAGEWVRETSRVTYMAEPIPCAYTNDGEGTRVLITGFEPFPADSDRDNSSKEAVEAYYAGEHPEGVAVMRAVLPVEYDAAPAIVEDIVARCTPDVVVGFGQGRSIVDVETIAYNRKDTAAVAGGVPDNRGVVYGGDPIVEGGPAERTTGLPADTIVAGLEALGIRARPSTDPGRYVCNNLFYTIMDVVEREPGITGGFVHLPRIPTVDDARREELRQTVVTVVDSALASR